MVALVASGELVDRDILPLMLQRSLRVDEAFMDSELVAINDPLREYWQRMNHGVVEEMVRHLSALKECKNQDLDDAQEWQRCVQGALYKSVLMMEAIKRGVTVEELMGEVLTDQKRESLLFSGPDFFEIKKMSEQYPSVPTGRAVLAMELLVRGIYNQVQAGVTDRQAQEWVSELYSRFRALAKGESIHDQKDLVHVYTDQDKASIELENGIRLLIEKGLINKDASILIVGPGDGKVEQKAISSCFDGTLNSNIKIVGVDPEKAVNPWKRMELLQQKLEEYAGQNEERFDLVISLGSGPHNDVSLHDWIAFNLAIQKVAKPGGVVMIESGVMDQMGAGGDNIRLQRALEFNKLNPSAFFGIFGIVPEHWRDGDSITDQAAIIFPSLIYELMAYLSDGKMVPELTNHHYSATGPNDVRGVWAWQTGQGEMLSVLEQVTRPYFVEAGQTEA